MRALWLVLLVIITTPVTAEEIRTIHVWMDPARAPVADDYALLPPAQLFVFHVGKLQEAQALMNRGVARHMQYTPSVEVNFERYRQAAGAYIQGSEFNDVKALTREAADVLSAAVHFRVTKVPTIIFNEKYAVTGVSSLREAVYLFEDAVP